MLWLKLELEWNEGRIGLVTGVSGGAGIIFTQLLFPPIARRLSVPLAFRISYRNENLRSSAK